MEGKSEKKVTRSETTMREGKMKRVRRENQDKGGGGGQGASGGRGWGKIEGVFYICRATHSKNAKTLAVQGCGRKLRRGSWPGASKGGEREKS